MKLDLTERQCLRMADLEGDSEVGVGFDSIARIAATPSCGCIFCDLDLPPVKMKRQWIHHIPSLGRIVVCETRTLKPGAWSAP